MTEAQRWAKTIKIPLSRWSGRCAEIAHAVVEAKLVRGTETRGLWVGPIAPRSIFAGRPLTGHSWITMPDGTVVDPTRWTFEMVTPYIYRGPAGADYDAGGNQFREANAGPCPSHDASAIEVTLACASIEVAEKIRTLLPPDSLALEDDPAVLCNAAQVHWLANCSPARLGFYVGEIYDAIVAAGYRAHIPIDNYTQIMSRSRRLHV